jgi:hypothetical protein
MKSNRKQKEGIFIKGDQVVELLKLQQFYNKSTLELIEALKKGINEASLRILSNNEFLKTILKKIQKQETEL